MSGIGVVTDSACDLTPELVDEYDVHVVPLTVRFGDQEFVDREELPTKEFWDRLMTDRAMPETAAPSPGAFQRVFLDVAESGAAGVVCITLSSKLSATYQSARMAATDVSDRIPVRVVDSLSVSMGLGLMVMTAAQLVGEGHTLEEIIGKLSDVRRRTRLFAVLGSLDFLKRGGRIGGAQAFLGSLLSIKPVLEVRDGGVEAESRQRTRRRALEYLAFKVLHAGRLEQLAVASGPAFDADELATLLSPADCLRDLVVSDLGPVIGAHAGPETIGVAFQIAN